MSGIKEVLAQILKEQGLAGSPGLRRVVGAWREAAGAEYFEQTHVVGWKKGTVTIEVSSAALLQELAVYRKRPLLEAMRRKNEAIVDLKFRPAATSRRAREK